MAAALPPGLFRDARPALVARRDERHAEVARELCAIAQSLGAQYVRGFALTVSSVTGLAVVLVMIATSGGTLTGRGLGAASLCVAVYGVAHLAAVLRWRRLVRAALPLSDDPIRDLDALAGDRPLLGLSTPVVRVTRASAAFPLIALLVLSPLLLHVVLQAALLAADPRTGWSGLGAAALRAPNLPLLVMAAGFASALVRLANSRDAQG